MTWIDFTRRNDPACAAAHHHFKQKLKGFYSFGGFSKLPEVLCFWTKAPQLVFDLYAHDIQLLRAKNVIVLAQVTLNGKGYRPLEPHVTEETTKLDGLIFALGGPEKIRARFDPIVFGFTKPSMFEEHCRTIACHGITYTTVNFLQPDYKNVGATMHAQGIGWERPSPARCKKTLKEILDIAASYKIKVSICAETAHFADELPNLGKARCADAEWAAQFKPELTNKLNQRSSRPGCGCCYSADWGAYASRGGWICPHQCVYCYAQKM